MTPDFLLFDAYIIMNLSNFEYFAKGHTTYKLRMNYVPCAKL